MWKQGSKGWLLIVGSVGGRMLEPERRLVQDCVPGSRVSIQSHSVSSGVTGFVRERFGGRGHWSDYGGLSGSDMETMRRASGL